MTYTYFTEAYIVLIANDQLKDKKKELKEVRSDWYLVVIPDFTGLRCGKGWENRVGGKNLY